MRHDRIRKLGHGARQGIDRKRTLDRLVRPQSGGARINPSDDLDRVVSEADIVILASPSAYLKKTLETLTVPLKEKFVISAIKGIVPDD